jgi:hypothetical protein
LALPVIGDLEQFSPSDELRAFIFSTRCIANERLDRIDEAQLAREQLTADSLDLLRRSEIQIYELLQTSLRQLGD